jgi:hypothetical protein
MEENDMYCGIRRVPKNKIRGTPTYCAQSGQVRYYGLKIIDDTILKMRKKKSLIREQLKLKRVEDNAKILINEVKKLKIILGNNNATKSQQLQAQKKMDELMVRKDKLLKQLRDQKKIIDLMEKQKNKKN